MGSDRGGGTFLNTNKLLLTLGGEGTIHFNIVIISLKNGNHFNIFLEDINAACSLSDLLPLKGIRLMMPLLCRVFFRKLNCRHVRQISCYFSDFSMPLKLNIFRYFNLLKHSFATIS